MDPSKILERFLDRPQVAELRAVLDVYGRAPGGLLANGLAFAALFASFPVALVTLSSQLVRSALPPVGSAMSSVRLGSTLVTGTLSVATDTLPLVR